MLDDKTKKSLIDYRKENFTVEVRREHTTWLGLDEVYLSVSQNGHQFTMISFTHDEWKRIKKEVEAEWTND